MSDGAVEELRVLRGELLRARAREQDLIDRATRAEHELALVRAELADSWEQLRELRRSPAWRAGRTLRAAQRWLTS